MNKTYSVGDKVWWARCGTDRIKKPCPICFGKRKVTLILGDESEVVLPCNYCAPGFESPTGTISEYEYIAAPEQVTIDRVSSETTPGGTKYEYRHEHWLLSPDIIFDTEEAALTKCEEIAEKLHKEETTRTEYLKKDKQKSFSWNAGYHLREAKRCRKEAERHEEKAVVCKERAR